ncbi:metalloendopeptidase-like membrane protein [Paramagnetospirillum caucaseum]|uniref:Metalloendopeptidase-like membrane protein n=1 Tax=Paramagnetospirillum caucaseum TaxID=1244869 RepID=M3AFN2_9PROT|nr:metalloendopeptidase-like membrane protein [Paramagnetospirillum caucaseum]EME71623.1 metalloendopeptidase-like membrane protein [Paramagnetospirillum caucaseum]
MDVQRLAKVLALAASDNDAEALHALRTAGRLLDAAGLDFIALASRLAESGPVVSATRMEDLEDTVFDLRNEVRHLRSENEKLRQTGPGPAGGLASAAQDAAQAIRLKAELDELRETLGAEKRRADTAQAAERALHADLAQAIGAAERLTVQFESLKGRADRLEAENRRLGLVAAALKGELDERIADRTHPLPPVTPPAPAARAEPVSVVASAPAPRRPSTPPPAMARRGKPAVPANQYALF